MVAYKTLARTHIYQMIGFPFIIVILAVPRVSCPMHFNLNCCLNTFVSKMLSRLIHTHSRTHTHIIFSSYRIKIAKCRNGFCVCCILPRPIRPCC